MNQELPPRNGRWKPMARWERRSELRHNANLRQAEAIRNDLDATWEILRTSSRVYLENLRKFDRSIPAIVYRGEPWVFDMYTQVSRIDANLAKIEQLESDGSVEYSPKVLEKYQKVNLLGQSHNKITPKDIAALKPHPISGKLSYKDIEFITDFFITPETILARFTPRLLKPSILTTNQIQGLIFLGTERLVHPDRTKVLPKSKSVDDLARNASLYFDYFADLLANPNLHPDDLGKLGILIRTGAPNLPSGVATYTPAKLGISPSSMVKLLQGKDLSSVNPLYKRHWKSLVNLMSEDAKQAFRSKGLPHDMQQYQLYDQGNEERAVELLKRHFASKDPAAEEQFGYRFDARDLIDAFKGHIGQIQKDIKADPGKRIKLPHDVNGFAGLVEVTSQYPNTVMLVIHLSDSTHLTVEIDREGRICALGYTRQKSRLC